MFSKALETAGNSSEVHFYYGRYLAFTGKLDAALNELEQARKLDPFSDPIAAHIAIVHSQMGRNDDAIREAQSVLKGAPEFIPALTALAEAYEREGHYSRVIGLARVAAARENHVEKLIQTAHDHALNGSGQTARREFAEAAKTSQNLGTPMRAVKVAWYYAALGDKNSAFSWLQKAFDEREPSLIFELATSASFDRLKSDRRWAELMQKLNLTTRITTKSSAEPEANRDTEPESLQPSQALARQV